MISWMELEMISLKELYGVLNAVVPLYVAMLLGYISVKRFRVFTAEQCSGINRFVAIFAVPLLSFDFISRIDPFRLHLLLLSADSLFKLVVLLLLFSWSKLFKNGSLDWSITIFSLATLPNTLVMGVPLLKSMYGDEEGGLLIQLVVMQSMLWYTLLLFLFEYRAARNAVVVNSSADQNHDLEIPQIVAKVAPQFDEEEHSTQSIQSTQSTQSKQSTQSCVGEDVSGGEDKKPEKFVRRISLLLIMKMVCPKLIRNLNFYATLLGISWALISSRWNVKKPLVMENSITILSNAGLGMAMFSLGLFMAMQPSIIPCGKRLATYSMLIRFVAGPAVMALASLVLGIRSTTLKVAIVQAALPQGIVPFVFAKEYDLHSEILSTAVIFGMFVSFPITIFYYIILGS